MGLRDELDVLLVAPHPTSATIARQILDRAGIPSLFHGRDIGIADIPDAHHELTRPDLLVPRGMEEKAHEVLRDAGFQ